MPMARHLLAVATVVAAASLLAPGAAGYPLSVCGTSEFKPNSTYQAKLNLLAAMLPKNASASPTLYATAVVGVVREQIRAMGLCRGDTSATSCLSCVTQAFRDLPNDCSYRKDATIFYDSCILHYSSDDVRTLNDNATTDVYYVTYPPNVTSSDQAQFKRLLATLLNATADHAAYNSTRQFATGEADFNQEFPKVYTLAQCRPDQTRAQCHNCLATTFAQYLNYFQHFSRAKVLWVNCSWRYETVPFFDGPAMVRLASPSPAAPSPAPEVGAPTAAAGGGERKNSVPTVIVAVVLPTLAALNLVFCFCFWMRLRPVAQAKQSYHLRSTDTDGMENLNSMMIDVSTLRTATSDFDERNKLGEGGSGAVYKGDLPGGEEIAVKRLSNSTTDKLKGQLNLVAKLKHKNLVRLVGICLEQQEQLLVYEFVPNGSLDMILFDYKNTKHKQLNWEQRFKIVNGIARGVQYLHEDSQPKVIHRDLKAGHILLDADMIPKISDFGLARFLGRDQMQDVTNCIVGTPGYRAPECQVSLTYSVKSDVFSFGIIVLEIITGRKINAGCNSQMSGDLLSTVWEHWEAGTVMELVDPSMDGNLPEDNLKRCIHIGLLCVQEDPMARPEMSYIVMTLGTDTVILQAPSKPALFSGRSDTNTTVLTDAPV